MRENAEKLQFETDAAFAFAAFLLNLLILLVVCASVWLLHTLTSQPDLFGAALSESMWR